MLKKLGLLSVVFGSLMFISAPGFSEDANMAACDSDMKKFCADKMGNDAKMCMDSHKAELSDDCKKMMDSAKR